MARQKRNVFHPLGTAIREMNKDGTTHSILVKQSDGTNVKTYFKDNNKIAQVVEKSDGTREVRRIIKDIDTKTGKLEDRPSITSIKNGDNIEIAYKPNSVDYAKKTIDLKNDTIKIKRGQRVGPWNGAPEWEREVEGSYNNYKQSRKEINDKVLRKSNSKPKSYKKKSIDDPLDYGDFKHIIETKLANDQKSISKIFSSFMNDALTSNNETLYHYIDGNGNIKFAINNDNNFSPTLQQTISHNQLNQLFEKEEWRQKAIDALESEGHKFKNYNPEDYNDSFYGNMIKKLADDIYKDRENNIVRDKIDEKEINKKRFEKKEILAEDGTKKTSYYYDGKKFKDDYHSNDGIINTITYDKEGNKLKVTRKDKKGNFLSNYGENFNDYTYVTNKNDGSKIVEKGTYDEKGKPIASEKKVYGKDGKLDVDATLKLNKKGEYRESPQTEKPEDDTYLAKEDESPYIKYEDEKPKQTERSANKETNKEKSSPYYQNDGDIWKTENEDKRKEIKEKNKKIEELNNIRNDPNVKEAKNELNDKIKKGVEREKNLKKERKEREESYYQDNNDIWNTKSNIDDNFIGSEDKLALAERNQRYLDEIEKNKENYENIETKNQIRKAYNNNEIEEKRNEIDNLKNEIEDTKNKIEEKIQDREKILEKDPYLKDKANSDLVDQLDKEIEIYRNEIKNKKNQINDNKTDIADLKVDNIYNSDSRKERKRAKGKWKQSERDYDLKDEEWNIKKDIGYNKKQVRESEEKILEITQQKQEFIDMMDQIMNDEVSQKQLLNSPQLQEDFLTYYDDTIKNFEDEIEEVQNIINKSKREEKALRNLHNRKYPELNSVKDMDGSKFLKTSGLNLAMSTFNGISTYKESRREGRSVASSAVRAGVDFAANEIFGLPYMFLSLVKEVPTLTVKGANALFTETRKMNSAANFNIFGDANFQDSQQLATMRQSGMELAKMSQYRLEQTLMGNEAKYLHR